MDDAVRIRVVFKDRHLLSTSLKLQGLKRSWLLLRPQHKTITDLSSYLTHIFDLHHSCPNGIILSMDGFVLPAFESTCILKDKDIIRIKRKDGTLCEIDDAADETNLIEDGEIVEKQPVLHGVLLIANKEFEKESGDYQCEPLDDGGNLSEGTMPTDNLSGENAVSKKRKASKELHSSKKKKKRSVAPQGTENDPQAEHNESCDNGALSLGKGIGKEEKRCEKKREHSKASTSRSAERNNDFIEPLPISKMRNGRLEENGAGCVDLPPMPDQNGTKKAPSRSARRKKARRQWLREVLKAEKEELLSSNLQQNQRQSPKNDKPKNSIEHQEQIQNSEEDDRSVADDEIVPIVIRPGHIRFEPLGKAQTVQQSQVSVETYQWNGITNKKKGQKWGKENFPSRRRNDHEDTSKECSEMMIDEKVELMMIIENVKPPNDPIDFDSLAPFAGLPKEGDVIAYRLLELSSTWTPELSSFRVGKTSRYCSESNSILLIPVPEYPIVFEKDPDDSCEKDPDDLGAQPNNSLYSEDGSLEIDFSSLLDTRIVKHGNSAPSVEANDGPVCNEVINNEVAVAPVDEQTHAPTPENEVIAWDEISQALSAKKAQLTQQNGGDNESSGTSTWSKRAYSSALGPTMALLRAQNGI